VCVCVCVFVALVVQHAMRMHSIILPSVVCRALPYFSTWSQKWHNFRKKVLNTNSVLLFSLPIFLKHYSF